MCCLKSESDVGFRELVFICYGGMIRGAIAFGLVLKIPKNSKNPHIGILTTTTLALVIITTVVFGSFMPIVQKCLFPEELVEDTEEAESF